MSQSKVKGASAGKAPRVCDNNPLFKGIPPTEGEINPLPPSFQMKDLCLVRTSLSRSSLFGIGSTRLHHRASHTSNPPKDCVAFVQNHRPSRSNMAESDYKGSIAQDESEPEIVEIPAPTPELHELAERGGLTDVSPIEFTKTGEVSIDWEPEDFQDS